jgi:hypothetical protein
LKQAKFEDSGISVRRRPTQRHRRNRFFRRALLVLACSVSVVCFALVALRTLSPSLFHSSRDGGPSRQSMEASRQVFSAAQQAAQRNLDSRPVYPYSVVPGGVRDAADLKWAAEHDPVVAAHYAGFDYDHARVVRLVLAQTAYVSYRIGNKVYWTRKRIKLKKGETVITDGKITARTRCANQVIQVPQQLNSRSEPSAAKFEEPINPLAGTAMTMPPVPFQSTLLTPPPPAEPSTPPLGVYYPIAGAGPFVPIAMPPLPGVCAPPVKKPAPGGAANGVNEVANDKKKKKVDPCGKTGVVATPEPATWLLLLSGSALMFWIGRRRLSNA